MKIKQKLILGFISIALLVAVVGYLSVIASQRALQESIGEQSTALASKMLEHIDRLIYSRVEHFQEYSTDLIVQRVISKSNDEFEKLDNIQAFISEKDREWTSVPKEKVTAFMKELINNPLSEELREKIGFYEEKYGYRVFAEVFATNKYGANTAQTGKTTDYRQDDEEWWQNAKKDGLYVADVEYDRSADVYSTDICIRIDDEAGNFLGVMKIVLNIEETINFITKAEAAEEEEEEHNAVEFKLLTKDTKIIYASEAFEFLQKLPIELSSRLHRDGDEQSHTTYFIAAGDKPGEEEELFAHAHSKGYKDFGGLGWILVVEHQTNEIFAPVAKLRARILIISLVVTALAVLLGLFISKTISDPIGRLAIAATEIGTGNLNTSLEVKSNDEVGQLSTSFNKMAEDLQKTTISIDSLNQEITQRKKAEEMLKVANQKLVASNNKLTQTTDKMEKAIQELKDFVYIASHDIREPLRKISSFGSLLKQSLERKLSPEDQENLEFMIEGAERMNKMIEGLLIYSRVGSKEALLEEVDLNQIIEQLKQIELSRLIEDTSAEIDVFQTLPGVWADSAQISQLLQNLIANGIKYCQKDVKPKIEITAGSTSDGSIRINVKDNGIGMEKQYRKEVFKMFRRLDSQRQYEGTGIGLSICKKIVEKHNGRIGVESEPGKGSTFWFALPGERIQKQNNEQQALFSSY